MKQILIIAKLEKKSEKRWEVRLVSWSGMLNFVDMNVSGNGYEVPGTPRALTLSALNALIGNAVRMERRAQGVWVVAELSDMRSSAGHFYAELIEKDARGATVARLRANLWAGTATGVRRKFFAATGRDIGSGLKVMLFGSVTHHPLYGLSFNIQDIDPSYTLGDLERLRREILETLAREGVSEMNKSLPVPVAPQKIAVISAAGAAGYGDFTDQLESSPEGFRFYPLLYGATMQGERTAASVMEALDSIEMTVDFWDAVVIIRGGGSTSDLNGFDNLELARRVATYPVPVIVGIGHERDRTVLDDIACVRCKTPTAVAAWLIDALRSALGRAYDGIDKISRLAAGRLEGDMRRLTSAEAIIPALARQRISSAAMALQSMAHRLPAAVGAQTSRNAARLASFEAAIGVSAKGRIAEAERRLKDKAREIASGASLAVAANLRKLEYLEKIAGALSPQETLKRGYSITRVGGKALTNAGNLRKDEVIETTLAEGRIYSVVIK